MCELVDMPIINDNPEQPLSINDIFWEIKKLIDTNTENKNDMDTDMDQLIISYPIIYNTSTNKFQHDTYFLFGKEEFRWSDYNQKKEKISHTKSIRLMINLISCPVEKLINTDNCMYATFHIFEQMRIDSLTFQNFGNVFSDTFANIGESIFEQIGNFISKTSLHDVRLWSPEPNSSKWLRIYETINSNHNIRKLHINFVTCIFNKILHNENITELIINMRDKNENDRKEMIKYLSTNKFLTKLIVNYYDPDALIDVLYSININDDLPLSSLTIYRDTRIGEIDDNNYNYLNIDTAKILKEILISKPLLKKIQILGCTCDEECGHEISQGIIENNTLSEFELQNNFIVGVTIKNISECEASITKIIIEASLKNDSLSVLKIFNSEDPYSDEIVSLLEENYSIKNFNRINVCDCGLLCIDDLCDHNQDISEINDKIDVRIGKIILRNNNY